MPWFRRSTAADSGAAGAAAAPAPHLQALKRQARNRLIGVAVLALLGIVLFAWVLDSEPRQSEREIVYQIPARGESLSVRIPAQNPDAAPERSPTAAAEQDSNTRSATLAPASDADTPAQIRARRRAALAETEEFIDDAPLAAGNDEPAAPSAAQMRAAEEKLAWEKLAKEKAAQEKAAKEKAAKEQATKEKAEKEQAAQAKAAEAARARALLEGKAEPASPAKAEAEKKPSAERSVVQFGSFSDADKAAETRRKVEAAGLKTYAQVIDTPRGKLIRVRVGPFNDPDEAAAAAKKIKALGLPAAILTL